MGYLAKELILTLQPKQLVLLNNNIINNTIMNRIFCLETEWDESIHDLKMKSSVLPLLNFVENKYNLNVQYAFRQVATEIDFEYYIEHLLEPSYKSYDFVYLCFHGSVSKIHFANGSYMSLKDFAGKYQGIFENRIVHFGCCCSLHNDGEVLSFKNETKALMVTGFTKKVSFMESFIFEMWLLKKIKSHPQYRSKRILELAEKEMPYYTKTLGFVAY